MQRRPRAMILAAGFGTRLGSLTALRPKPMLPICGTPLVRWSVLWLRSQGIREIVINLHHLGHLIEAALGDGRELGVDIVYSREDGEILGTGGGVLRARAQLDDGHGTPIVVVNGKILVDLALDPALAEHRARRAEATMVLRPDADAARWGSLRVDDEGRVIAFLGSEREGAREREPLMFTGVQLLSPAFLDRIPGEGAPCIVRTAYTELWRERGRMYGHVTRAYWAEHSTVERYLAGVCRVLDGEARLAHAERPLRGVDPGAELDRRAELRGPVWIGRGARIEAGAVVGPHVQVGDGAVVAAGARLTRSVVWEGVRAAGELRDAVCGESTNMS